MSKPSKAWGSLAVSLAVLALCLAAGCQSRGGQDPCADGCAVPGADASGDYPLYVPLCEDTDTGAGPCVMLDDVDAVTGWWYVPAGHVYPDAVVRLALCATEDGDGTGVPCVWVPSVQGNGQGDSGAYVYRVAR
jgi:hypothetical protein